MDVFIFPTCTYISLSANLPPSALYYPKDPCVEFQWGEIGGTIVVNLLYDAYEEVVHWQRNRFWFHLAKWEMRLYWSLLDCIKLMLMTLLCTQLFLLLVLFSKYYCFRNLMPGVRLQTISLAWSAALLFDVQEIFQPWLRKVNVLQDHLQSIIHKSGLCNVACAFDRLMSMGKVSDAVKLLSADAKGGVLSLGSQISCGLDNDGCVSQSVKDILVYKNPPARRAVPESLLSPDDTNVPSFDLILFDCLTGDMIKVAAFQTHGASGPSGVDAYSWRRLCSSFGHASIS